MQVENHWNYPGCSSLTAAVDTFLTIFFRKLFDLIWQGGDRDDEDTCHVDSDRNCEIFTQEQTLQTDTGPLRLKN